MDFKNIIIVESLTLFQALGALTIILAVINVLLYIWAAALVWRTRHEITKTLRDKLVTEALLTLTTIAMGFGAFLDLGSEYWFIAYASRVVLLFLTPIILYRMIKAFLAVAHRVD